MRRAVPAGLVLGWALAHVGRFSYNLGPPTDRGCTIQQMQTSEPASPTCDCSMFVRWAMRRGQEAIRRLALESPPWTSST